MISGDIVFIAGEMKVLIKSREISLTKTAVSYTHLEYIWQESFAVIGTEECFKYNRTIYTKICEKPSEDVYKRQVMSCVIPARIRSACRVFSF